MSEWIPILWERKQDMDAHILGLQISCSTSPFYDGLRYAVRNAGGQFVLNHNGEWEREPIPSNRESNFYERCRFSTFEEASNAAEVIARKGEMEEKEYCPDCGEEMEDKGAYHICPLCGYAIGL